MIERKGGDSCVYYTPECAFRCRMCSNEGVIICCRSFVVSFLIQFLLFFKS